MFISDHSHESVVINTKEVSHMSSVNSTARAVSLESHERKLIDDMSRIFPIAFGGRECSLSVIAESFVHQLIESFVYKDFSFFCACSFHFTIEAEIVFSFVF